MEIKIKAYRGLPCELEVFKINGSDADKKDFGVMDSGGMKNYSCKNMRFIPNFSKEFRENTIKKYNINIEDYIDICDELSDKLNVGACGLCL